MADTRSTDSVIPHEVRDLIQESQKIQGWIEGLADHADEARPEVYRKVLSDYEQRLAGVNEALAKHRAELVDTLEKRKAELAGLRTDRDEQAAELEEARLRHAVGEYDDAEWEERRDRVQQALDDVDELLAGEEETVAELDEIIASIGTAGPRLVTDREPSPALGAPDAIEPEADAADAPDTRAEAAPTRPATASSTPGDTGVESDLEEEAVDAAEAESSEEEGAAVAEGAEAPGSDADDGEAEEGGDYLDELEFLESLSLGDAERFDAVSAMLDDDEGAEEKE